TRRDGRPGGTAAELGAQVGRGYRAGRDVQSHVSMLASAGGRRSGYHRVLGDPPSRVSHCGAPGREPVLSVVPPVLLDVSAGAPSRREVRPRRGKCGSVTGGLRLPWLG